MMKFFKNFSEIQNIEKRTCYYLCGFSFFLPLSKALGNIFLTLSLLAMVHRLFRKNDDVRLIFGEYKKIFATIAFLLAAVFISALTSADIFYGVKKFLEKYILHMSAMLPILLICDREKIFKIVKCLFAGVFISNSIVIVQALQNLDKFWRFGGLLGGMPQGSLIAASLPICIVSIINVKPVRWKIFFIISAVTFFWAMIFNGARGVWLAMLILIPAVVLICAKHKLKALGGLILIFMAVAGIFINTPNLSARFSSITDMQMQSNSERLLMWKSALNMFEDNPIFGVGYGQYKFAYQQEYIMPEAKERHQEHAHNNIIQMLAECGIVGAAAFIFWWGYLTYFSLRLWFKYKNFEWLLYFCVLWAIMLHGLTEFNFETSVTSKVLWYSLGLCMAYNRLNSKN